jgi:hypothetical protein
MESTMAFADFIGYMNTSSALKTLRERSPNRNEDPLGILTEKLLDACRVTNPSATAAISVRVKYANKSNGGYTNGQWLQMLIG